jgi:rhomboid protease GluP
LLDRLVELLAQALDAVGLNGTRLRWKWNKRKRDLGEAGMQAEMVVRSTQVAYKMCPSCRALVPRSARRCTECGAPLAGVRAPGITRVLGNLIPGTTATSAGLMLVNTAMFGVMLLLPVQIPGYEAGEMIARLIGFDTLTAIRYGSGHSGLTVGLHEWWRLVTPVFLHGGLLHFVFNSMALVRLGPLVEEEFGTERLAAIYVVCGIAGSAASQLTHPVNTLGASGALCGLLGLLLVHGWRIGGAYGGRLKAVMSQNVIIMLGMSFLPGIDWRNHAGGFLAGCVLGAITPSGPFRNRFTEVLWQVFAWGAAGVIGLSFWMMTQHGGDHLVEILRQYQRFQRLP